MKAAVAALALLPMVSAQLTDVTEAFIGAFGHADALNAAGQKYLFACYKNGDPDEGTAERTLYLTPPSGGYKVDSGAAFCGTEAASDTTCGTCAEDTTRDYFAIDKKVNQNCGDGLETAIVGFSNFNYYLYETIDIADGVDGDYTINVPEETTPNPGGGTHWGVQWQFVVAHSLADRCATTVTVTHTPPPPAECADATTPTAYQSLGCCNC